jgi:hypothetical protein
MFFWTKQGVSLVEEYDRKFLYSMLVKCHKHLHPWKRSNVHITFDQDSFDQDCNLDIFEQTKNISELAKKVIKKELLIFRQYQLDVKDIKCLL